MKPNFFVTILLLTGVSLASFAQNQKPSSTLHFSESITSLNIDGDMTVVLVEGTSSDVVVDGDPKDIFAKQTDGHLSLVGRIDRSVAYAKVYVPAGFLSRVYVNGAAVLKSASTLSNRNLKIFMQAEGKVHVQSTGNVTVETSDDIRFMKDR